MEHVRSTSDALRENPGENQGIERNRHQRMNHIPENAHPGPGIAVAQFIPGIAPDIAAVLIQVSHKRIFHKQADSNRLFCSISHE